MTEVIHYFEITGEEAVGANGIWLSAVGQNQKQQQGIPP
jgi:hypothetical protein